MRLKTSCAECGSDLYTSTFAEDRVDYVKRKGEYFRLNCKNCGHQGKYHVDDLYATPSKMAEIIALGIFLIGTPLLFWLIWEVVWQLTNIYMIAVATGVFLVPSITYVFLLRNQRLRVNAFNRHKYKGRIRG